MGALRMQIMRVSYFVGYILGCFLLLIACTPPSATEIFRISNAKGNVDAVMVELNTDATVATPTEIYLIPKDDAISGKAVLRADKVENMKLIWTEPDILTIRATDARIFVYPKSFSVKLKNSEVRNISIKLDVQNLISN